MGGGGDLVGVLGRVLGGVLLAGLDAGHAAELLLEILLPEGSDAGEGGIVDDQPDLEITPPDALVSVTYQWTGDDLEQITAMADNLPSSVVRAKGFIEADGNTFIFSYVMGDWSIEDSGIPPERITHKNIVVFIGPIESMEGIHKAAGTGNWSKGDVLQPNS